MVPEKYITLQELSEQTQIPYTTLRKWVKKLGIQPDNITELPNGIFKYSYGAASLRMLYDSMMAHRNLPVEHYRSCYQCRKHCHPADLKGGLCPLCQARKIVLNYGCHGDPVGHALDADRLEVLIEAIRIVKDTYEDPHSLYD